MIFFRWLHRIFFIYPREQQKISDEIETAESICIEKINSQIINASKNVQTNGNSLWKKIQQNLIDNQARFMLEEHYIGVRNKLLERDDFGKKYVQVLYEYNERKISTLLEEHPYIELDIESEFSQSVIDAYAKFSSAWFRMVNNSALIKLYGSPMLFPKMPFGCVSVGNKSIPCFKNYVGDIIYFFPSFVIILKKDLSITFHPLVSISIELYGTEEEFESYNCPKDAFFVKETWEHSNKDGSRDARFSNNKRYLICRMICIEILGTSESFTFEVSNYELSSRMKDRYQNLKETIRVKSVKSDTDIQETDIDPIDINTNDKESMMNRYQFFDLDAADPLFVDVVHWILSTHSVSQSSILRRFNIGFIRVGKILEEIEAAGIISSATTISSTKEIEFTIAEFNYWLAYQKSLKRDKINRTEDNEKVLDKRNECPVDRKRPKDEEHSKATKELDELIGLQDVKEEINKLKNFVRIQLIRQSQGLKISPISYHCVFTGNPGTGKTTVARIVAEIYRDMGILKSGHLVETDRAGLVAEYIGQTAVKTNKVIDSALDGVLFIDEAYSLVQGYSNDFGHEAISTLIKRMEDERDRLVVILAGYGNEMKTFIDANPGLQSRFNRYIHFNDYSANDLMAIFELNLKKQQYKMSDSAKAILMTFLDNAVANKDRNFGNGRFVRNIFEQTLQNQATRLCTLNNLSREALQLIVDEDIPAITINAENEPINMPVEVSETPMSSSVYIEKDKANYNLRPKFWRTFIDYNSKHNGPYAFNESSGKDNWIARGIGISGMDISAIINGHSCRSQIGINFGEGRGKNKAIFDYLFQNKDKIQCSMPDFPLVWERMDNKIACRIHTDLTASYLVEEKWPEIMEFLLKSSKNMIEVFSKHIPDIKKALIIYSEGNHD